MKITSTVFTIALALSSTSILADDKDTRLTKSDCKGIVNNAIDGANLRDSDFRPDDATTKMQIYCMNRTGKILAYHNMADAWIGSIDIAKAKAYTAASLALHGSGEHFMPLDACIAAMKQTGLEMSDKYKETSLGGLAVSLTEC